VKFKNNSSIICFAKWLKSRTFEIKFKKISNQLQIYAIIMDENYKLLLIQIINSYPCFQNEAKIKVHFLFNFGFKYLKQKKKRSQVQKWILTTNTINIDTWVILSSGSQTFWMRGSIIAKKKFRGSKNYRFFCSLEIRD
jgi:hypothetical protein